MGKTTQVNFRLANLQPELEARSDGDIGVADVRRVMERYFATLRQELQQVQLSEAEASLLVDALNGVLFEPPETARLLWAEVDDAIRLDGLDRKWGVDSQALIERLRRLTFAQALAVVDAVERAWKILPESDDRRATLRAVGLVREGSPSLSGG